MKVSQNRKISITVGVLILVAYSMLIGESDQSKMPIMFGDVISGLAVIAIAVLMFPLLKPYGEKLSLLYARLKYAEGGIMIIAGISLLFLTPFLRDWIYIFHAYIFAVSAIFFYLLLYKSKLVPRFISNWGIVASVLLLGANLLEIKMDSLPMIILIIGYLPIILNEVFLAMWLIFKGFRDKETEFSL